MQRRSGCLAHVKTRGLTPRQFLDHVKEPAGNPNLKLALLMGTSGNNFHGVAIADDGAIPKG
eukprot:2103686-Pyramimonas_sp.AAC.1